MSGDGWEELLGQLDDNDASADSVEWGESFPLGEGDTFLGFWRGQDSFEGEDKDTGRKWETPIYLLRDRDGNDVFIWGGRAQLDKRIKTAAPKPGDRIAIRRLEDAPAQEGFNPAWRVRVAVEPGGGGSPSEAPGEDDDLPFHHLDRFELS